MRGRIVDSDHGSNFRKNRPQRARYRGSCGRTHALPQGSLPRRIEPIQTCYVHDMRRNSFIGEFLGCEKDFRHDCAARHEVDKWRIRVASRKFGTGFVGIDQPVSARENLASQDRIANPVASRLERALIESYEQRKPLSVVMLDVDHFKKYNDALGHQQGDECLKAVAAALEQQVNASGEAHMLARYGGEEFAAILRTNASTAQYVSEKLRSSIQELQLVHPNSTVGGYVSISVGLTTVIPDERSTASDLLAAADSALYQAKNTGRNRVVMKS